MTAEMGSRTAIAGVLTRPGAGAVFEVEGCSSSTFLFLFTAAVEVAADAGRVGA